jgi:target of rapamycin complex 2 subunit MAPKAP1
LLISSSYLIHRIRLGYLRDSEDPYASRIVGLDPLHPWNRYIVTGGLGDRDRWPEIDMPQSPEVSDDEDEKEPSGFPRSKLRYTQTIMGGRSGALGMRVHGKRASTSKRLSHIQAAAAAAAAAEKNPGEDVSNFVKNGAPVQALEALSSSAAAAGTGKSLRREGSWEQIVADGGEDGRVSPGPSVKIQVPTAPEEAPVANVVRFVPKFTAETEARRRMRIQARRGPTAAPQAPQKPLSWDTSSEEETMPDDSDSSSDYGEEVSAGIDSMDEGDEFDP